jgi:hypothetical protein
MLSEDRHVRASLAFSVSGRQTAARRRGRHALLGAADGGTRRISGGVASDQASQGRLYFGGICATAVQTDRAHRNPMCDVDVSAACGWRAEGRYRLQ